ncbi:glycoside hydrolase family 13 protein [Aspergillus luchuensis CBS 106.47]|uniref:Glycoside hydrolase family 13 protein n=1 Tax=Aspergillus luchuensis (strain CBS 106.47) TaxID=1137211 RepID=A0A1M3T741_ASPLC|nr:glycoside hydrolase family 13 protein [Aspergillus luchuensis CBS 106.47]
MCPKSHYSTPKWWKEAVVYQVYPASFNCGTHTSKTNGWGDVTGIIDKVPYLKSLGVDIVWLSPSESNQSGHECRNIRTNA